MRRTVAFAASLAVVVAAEPVLAGGAGTTAVNFLKISAGARPTGMGEAFVGTADDVTSLYWNPSGLAQLSGWELQLMHGAWMQGVNYEYLALGGPVGNAGTFGFSVTGLLANDIPGYDLDPNGQPISSGTLSATAVGGTIGYGQRLDALLGMKDSLDVAVGASVKFASYGLGGTSHIAFDADLGGLWRINEMFQIGAVLADMGTAPSIGFSTPLHVRVGGSFLQGGLMTRGDRLTLDADTTIWVDETPKIHLGAEYAIPMRPVRAALRIGYKIIPDTGPLAGLTVGFGLALITHGSFEAGVDYAMVPYGELGISHRLSLGMKF